MKKHDPVPPPAADRLSGIPRLARDEDERPSREDRAYGQTIFTRPPVQMPRFLTRRRRRPIDS